MYTCLHFSLLLQTWDQHNNHNQVSLDCQWNFRMSYLTNRHNTLYNIFTKNSPLLSKHLCLYRTRCIINLSHRNYQRSLINQRNLPSIIYGLTTRKNRRILHGKLQCTAKNSLLGDINGAWGVARSGISIGRNKCAGKVKSSGLLISHKARQRDCRASRKEIRSAAAEVLARWRPAL